MHGLPSLDMGQLGLELGQIDFKGLAVDHQGLQLPNARGKVKQMVLLWLMAGF